MCMQPTVLDLIGDDEIFTCEQVAELVGKNAETVRRWCRTGKLPTLGPGHYRIAGEDLKQFIRMVTRRSVSHS